MAMFELSFYLRQKRRQSIHNSLRAAGQAVWWTGRDGALLVKLAPELAVWGHAERPEAGCVQ